jgi:lipoprotein NlpI
MKKVFAIFAIAGLIATASCGNKTTEETVVEETVVVEEAPAVEEEAPVADSTEVAVEEAPAQ